MERQPSYAAKTAGYALVYCHQCRDRQRVQIGEDPEGWVKISTLRGEPIKVLCPECAGGLGEE